MSYDSIISKAHYLREEHIKQWDPYTTSYHRYWTRAEKKRVFTAISNRDVAFVRHFLDRSKNTNSDLERTEAAIISLTYLTKAHFLFQRATFRDVVWNKMNQFEVNANHALECIERITSREEYEKEATMRNYLYELLHVIWCLRDILRGANDHTFHQG